MADLDDRVIDAATDRGTLRAEDLLALCEQYEKEGGPGVSQERLLAYARELGERDVSLETGSEELADQERYAITDGLLLQELRARRTDATDWEGERIYVLDTGDEDRLSAYPRSWHEAIGGETDIEAVFSFLETAEPFRQDADAGTGKISVDRLIAVASVVGGLEPDDARDRVETLEAEGSVVESTESGDLQGLESREAGASADLPPMVDFRKALDEIEARSDADVSEEIETIHSQLAEFAERDDDEGRESLLSAIDRLTVDIESRASGAPARRARGIRNQIEAYRQSVADGESGLSLSGPTLLSGGSQFDPAENDGALAVLEGTLVNGGDGRSVVATCTFYDEQGTVVQSIETRTYEMEPGEQREVAIDLFVPSAATRYTAMARAASESRIANT